MELTCRLMSRRVLTQPLGHLVASVLASLIAAFAYAGVTQILRADVAAPALTAGGKFAARIGEIAPPQAEMARPLVSAVDWASAESLDGRLVADLAWGPAVPTDRSGVDHAPVMLPAAPARPRRSSVRRQPTPLPPPRPAEVLKVEAPKPEAMTVAEDGGPWMVAHRTAAATLRTVVAFGDTALMAGGAAVSRLAGLASR